MAETRHDTVGIILKAVKCWNSKNCKWKMTIAPGGYIYRGPNPVSSFLSRLRLETNQPKSPTRQESVKSLYSERAEVKQYLIIGKPNLLNNF